MPVMRSGRKSAVAAGFAAVAEAHRLRHGDIEFELVGMIGIGREIAIGIDRRIPGAAAGSAAIPAIRYTVGEEVAAADHAMAVGELVEFDAVGEELPLEAAIRPQRTLGGGVELIALLIALPDRKLDVRELFFGIIRGEAGNHRHLEHILVIAGR